MALLWEILDTGSNSIRVDESLKHLSADGHHIPMHQLTPLREAPNPQTQPPSDHFTVSMGATPTPVHPMYFSDSLIDNDLFNNLEIPLLSHIQPDLDFSFHGGL